MPQQPLTKDDLRELVGRSEAWLADLNSRLNDNQELATDDGQVLARHALWRALFRRGRLLADHGETELARRLYQFAEEHCADESDQP